MRIVFGVPDDDAFSRFLPRIASSLPEAECLFLGFSWSTGIDIRKSRARFKHSPLKHIPTHVPHTMPYYADLVGRGYSQDSIPNSAKRAFATVKAFLDTEIDRFIPDVVVTGPCECVICHLLTEIAKARSIPVVSIQTSFMSDYYLIHSQGGNWIDYFTNAQLPDLSSEQHTAATPVFRSVAGSGSGLKKRTVIKGFERLVRLAFKGVSHDTWEVFTSRIISQFLPKKWFPTIKTVESIDDIEPDCVLVVLNQPALTPQDSPTWIDLVTLALEATPEEVPLVLRPHPCEPARDLSLELENALRLRNVLVSRAECGPNLSSIIRHCRAVLTLNSAVGMEALLEGKPVFTFCSAFYTRPGMACSVSVSDVGLIREMLRKHDQYQPDPVEVMKFLSWLMSEHIVSKGSVSGNAHVDRQLVQYVTNAVKQGY